MSAARLSPGRAALNGAAGLSLGFILLPLVLVTWLAFFRQEIPSFPPEGYTLRWFPAILDNRSFVNGFLLSLKIRRRRDGDRPAPRSAGEPRHRAPPLPVSGRDRDLALDAARHTGRGARHRPLCRGARSRDRHSLAPPGVDRGAGRCPHAPRHPVGDPARHREPRGLRSDGGEAAKNLGAGPWTVFRRVTLPAIRPGIVAAALFGFVISFGNLEASLFLVGPGQTTLPIAILQYLAWKIDPSVAAMSVAQIVLIGGAMLITDRYVKLAQVV
jgi:putative spermidine/putrescine transport system permease protein